MDLEKEHRSRWELAHVAVVADGSGLMKELQEKALTIVIDSLSTSKRQRRQLQRIE